MRPPDNNEIRDLQPVVRRLILRVSFVSSMALLGASILTLVAALRVLLLDEQVWAVTQSGHVFAIQELPQQTSKSLLAKPEAQLALQGVR